MGDPIIGSLIIRTIMFKLLTQFKRFAKYTNGILTLIFLIIIPQSRYSLQTN
jgi:hypothetical protein